MIHNLNIKHIFGLAACVAFFVLLPAGNVQAGTVGASPTVISTTTAPNSCVGNLSCGLVGYWTFDGKDVVNGALRDLSGNGNTGTITNIATTTFYRSGNIGQAFFFDGVNDYIDLGQPNSLKLTGSMTISAWINMSIDASACNSCAILTNMGFSGARGFGFNLANGLVGFDLPVNSTTLASRVSATTILGNRWYHVVAVYNASAQTSDIYVNGALDNGTLTGTVPTSMYVPANNFRIGSRPVGDDFMRGRIDDLRMYNRALSATEIRQLYNTGKTAQGISPNQTATTTAQSRCSDNLSCGLVGYWTFDGKHMSNGVLRDISPNANNGSLNNIATTTFYRPGVIGQAFSFDGVDDYVDLGQPNSLKLTGSMTISAWVNVGVAASVCNSCAILTNQGASGARGFEFYIANGILGIDIPITSTTLATRVSATTMASNRWYHVVAVYNATAQTLNIYNNGTLDNSTLTGTVPASMFVPANNFRIGSRPVGDDFMKGRIDDLRMYNRALSATEVGELYNMGKSTQGVSPNQVATTTAQSRCVDNLSCGLVGYWTFDGKHMNNGTARDLSGNGNTLTLSNISTTTFYVPGKFGQGFNFDGTNDTASAGSGASLDDVPALTVSLWVKARSYGAGGGGYLVGKATTASGGAGWFFRITQSNSLISFGAVFNTTSLAVDSALNSFTTAADMNRWVHLVATWDRTLSATGVKIYKNGVEQSYSTQTSGVGTYNSDAALNLVIGDGGAVSTRQSNATLDDVRVYNRVLTASEVRRLYNQGK